VRDGERKEGDYGWVNLYHPDAIAQDIKIPMGDGLKGLRVRFYCTAHPSSSLYLSFKDADGQSMSKMIPLERDGARIFDLPFNSEGFNMKKKRGLDGQLEEPRAYLQLKELAIVNDLRYSVHRGLQQIRLLPFEYIVDPKKAKNLPSFKMR